jgi:hypothetical protein
MMSLCMVEANHLLKLLSGSTIDIYNMFEHIDLLSMGMR